MKKSLKFVFSCLFFIIGFFMFAGERTIPVDIFLMIDKSLSMEDPGKFDSLQKWVLEDLIGQMLIKDDWITIYQFYEKPEHLLTLNISDNNSKQQVYNTVKAIKPDGPYTDIGYALETVQAALDERGSNGRFKVLLLLSDLIQDAPWTSKYRGKQDSFKSPYLVEARTIKHDNWYEITLDMDIQDAVVQRTQSLYSDVVANEGVPRTKSNQSEALVKGDTKVVTTENTESSASSSGTNASGASGVADTTVSSSTFDNDTNTESSASSNGTNVSGASGVADTTVSSSTFDNDTNTESSASSNGTNATGASGVADTTGASSTLDNDTNTESSASSNGTNVSGASGVADTTVSSSTLDNDTNTESSASSNGTNVADTSGTSTDENNLVTGTSETNKIAKAEAKKTSGENAFKAFFARHGTLVFIVLGVLILLILLIVFIMHLIRESNRKKEANKEKINLV